LKVLTVDEKRKSREEELERAHKACADRLRENPGDVRTLCVLGFVEFQLGRAKEAEARLEKAYSLAPESSEIAYNYGLMLMSLNKFADALPIMQRVIALRPDHCKAYHCIGKALKESGDLEGALASLNKSLEFNPLDPDVLNDRGNALNDMGRLPEAAVCYKQALDIRPDDHLIMNNLGVVRFLQNDLDGAEALHRRAMAIEPEYPEALSNLSIIRRLRGDLDGAIRFCQKALALRSQYPEALNNLGNSLKDAGRLEEAVAAYNGALRLIPENPEFHHNLAIALLALGRFEEGWREYEWRWKSKQLSHVIQRFAQPEWRGEAGAGRTLLILAEQGFGDTLQFCRYAPLAKERGFHVVIGVPPALKRLIESLDGVERVVTGGDVPVRFDVHCSMMSLPFIFRTTVETIPAGLPYLRADPADVAAWRERVATVADGFLKVGLVWAGSLRVNSPDLIATDRKRSITPEVLLPLMDVPGVRFFSLQKTGASAPEFFHVIDWMADCNDFADTAALLMNMDLVIGVDTAVTHLAGALGKPFWLLNRFNSCWRWLVEREDSPWYPGTLRLFRQKKMGDWDEVVMRVRDALAEMGGRGRT
jgi:Flp pilus assembly protein TadD